jgi:hypothetical protein
MKSQDLKDGCLVTIKNFSTRPASWNKDGRMDYLMGQTVKVYWVSHDKEHIHISDNGKNSHIGYWSISVRNIVLDDEVNQISEPNLNVIL